MKRTLYHLLCFLRIFLVFLPQIGYIHPDEHFQGPEIVYGDIFGFKVLRTWEFTSFSPVRTVVFPYLLMGISSFLGIFLDLRKFHRTALFPYILLLLPRLIMCAFSFLNDFLLYKMCILMKKDYKLILNLFASSYVTLIYLTRTFSNSVETLFFTFILFLLTKMLHISNGNSSHLIIFIFDSFMVGLTFTLGFFNRPTFICFSLYPLIIWFKIMVKMKINVKKKFNLLTTFVLGVCSIFIPLTAIDTCYYKEMHYSFITSPSKIWGNLVSTPVNFILYNINSKNLDSHGLHPRWLHFLINVPLLFSVYGILTVISVFLHLFKLFKYKQKFSCQTHFSISLIVPLLLLSFIPHQEPRFIIPLIIPVCILYADVFSQMIAVQKICVALWCVSNILGVIFYGFVHQAGIYLSLSDIHVKINNNTAVIFYKTYMPPRYMLAIEKNENINVYDFTGITEEKFQLRMENVITESAPQHLFLVLPFEIPVSIFKMCTNLNYKLMSHNRLFPHLSTETLPDLSTVQNILINNSSFITKIYNIKDIYSIHVTKFQHLLLN